MYKLQQSHKLLDKSQPIFDHWLPIWNKKKAASIVLSIQINTTDSVEKTSPTIFPKANNKTEAKTTERLDKLTNG